ncbi:DUF2141 domain-containing protein [Pararhodonellum marinum]|uniref:DUF2141 domain-containing protein n=1 Tax=Pararhodonellum marinum TaxID=2755358 RepID=UPI00188FA177|nr:DUF2141 domain-containing protein [Pararhodonellum marinum]
MKNILIIFLPLLMVLTNLPLADGELTLTVADVKSSDGVIRVLLFKSSDGFPDEPDKAVKSASVKIEGNKAVVTFKDLPQGTYALSVFHDSRNVGKLRTNALGIPRDGYGFSNNASGTFGPPSFEKAAFQVKAGQNKHEINLK